MWGAPGVRSGFRLRGLIRGAGRAAQPREKDLTTNLTHLANKAAVGELGDRIPFVSFVRFVVNLSLGVAGAEAAPEQPQYFRPPVK